MLYDSLIKVGYEFIGWIWIYKFLFQDCYSLHMCLVRSKYNIIEDSARRVRIMLYLPGPNTYLLCTLHPTPILLPSVFSKATRVYTQCKEFRVEIADTGVFRGESCRNSFCTLWVKEDELHMCLVRSKYNIIEANTFL